MESAISLLALSYPELEQDDLDWIQRFRSEHDRNYELLGPHFTLVYPVDGIEREAFIENVLGIVKCWPVISFTCRCATVVPNRVDGGWHIFLVPDEGHSEIVKLHDKLYTGWLAGSLRLDLNFIPHMTVGDHVSADRCKALADELNARDFRMSGKFLDVHIASYTDNKIVTIAKAPLAP